MEIWILYDIADLPNTTAIDFNTCHLVCVAQTGLAALRPEHLTFLVFLLQPAASFHSARLMSDTKANVSCEIPA